MMTGYYAFMGISMRVSFLGMIALAGISFLCAHTSAFAMPIAIQDGGVEETQSTQDVMSGTSTWELDNEHTSLVCAASHYGLSFIYGRFNQCSGTIKMNFERPSASTFRFEVAAGSIDTNNEKRDIALCGGNGLDVQNYDSIVFESSSVEAKDQQIGGKTQRTLQVTGNLNLHGETRRITMPIQLLAMGSGPDGKVRCGFMSRFVVNRSEFGLDAMADTVGDNIAITFSFQALLKATEAVDEFAPDNDRTTQEAGMESDRKRLEELFKPKSSGENEVAPDSDPNESSGGEIDG